MAELYKVLGQAAPSATTNTDLYTVPADTYAVCSSIVACNRAGTAGTFRVAVRPLGASIANQHYIYYDADISANDTGVFNLGLSLSETDVVTVYASSADMSFNLFGVELDDTTVGIGSSEVDRLTLDFVAGTNIVWTNMPLALTELFSVTCRKIVDLTQYDDVRLMVCRGAAASVAGAAIRAQYSTDNGASWNYFDGGIEPSVEINFVSSVQASSWITMNVLAKANVQVRIVGISGNGAADPNFSQISLEFR
jgi:hypothetical protein